MERSAIIVEKFQDLVVFVTLPIRSQNHKLDGCNIYVLKKFDKALK